MNYGPIMVALEGPSITSQELDLLKIPTLGGVLLNSRHYTDAQTFKQNIINIQKNAKNPLLIAVENENDNHKENESKSSVFKEINALPESKAVFDLSAKALYFPFPCSSPCSSETAKNQTKTLIDKRTREELNQEVLNTFQTQCAKFQAILPASIIFPEIDNVQVGYSKHWLQQILRQELKFKGVIINDSLASQGALGGDYVVRARLALDAGCDMVILRHPDLQLISWVLNKLDRSTSSLGNLSLVQ